MNILLVILQVLLGLTFLAGGGATLVGVDYFVGEFERYGYPQWFRVVTGIVEVIGALGLLIGVRYPALAGLAGLWLTATMAGAVLTHVLIQDPPGVAMPAVVMLALVLLVALLRFPSLRSWWRIRQTVQA